ncbi:hypothetical protein Scep_027828 [Stephania cephalantha]|uniref:Uncharacterized protein n=1 Tax=Stephania cephalantha TaxID=152367 RepID=A0AAP0E8R9_9MAGN
MQVLRHGLIFDPDTVPSVLGVSYGDDSYTVGDGSYTVGDCISETLTFNDAASVDNIAHGCGHNIECIFVGAAGVYKGVTTSQLDELAAETAAAMTASHPDYASVNVLVLVWVLGRWGVGVGGEVIPVAEAAVGSGGGGVIVDLGIAVTSGDGGEDEFRGARGWEAGGVALFHTRYDPRRENVSVRRWTWILVGEVGEASGEELFGAKSPAAQYVNNSEIVDV